MTEFLNKKFKDDEKVAVNAKMLQKLIKDSLTIREEIKKLTEKIKNV